MAKQPLLNDPTGFWGDVARENAANGLGSLLPTGTNIAVDRSIRSQILSNQIAWDAIECVWGKIRFLASVQDGQMLLVQEPGGTEYDGSITLVVNKDQFNGAFPQNDDTLEIKLPNAGSKFKAFSVTGVIGLFDTTDASLTITAVPEDSNLDE